MWHKLLVSLLVSKQKLDIVFEDQVYPAATLNLLIRDSCWYYSGENWRDGVVVRAYASQSVNLGFIFQVESYQKT